MAACLLSSVVVLLAALSIWSDRRGRWTLVYVFRPLSLLVLIFLAGVAATPETAFYKYEIVAGLAFSLLGDIFMMLRQKKFTAGLASFLAAQLFYVAAFWSGIHRPLLFWPLLPLIFYALLIGFKLIPRSGRMKIPVLIYVSAIIAMAWLAGERYLQLQGGKAFFALAGAILFVVSDSVLAYNRFVRPLRWAQVLILGTYFPAQLLIALSV
jgi:uncharacterized membrane protein YhhN